MSEAHCSRSDLRTPDEETRERDLNPTTETSSSKSKASAVATAPAEQDAVTNSSREKVAGLDTAPGAALSAGGSAAHQTAGEASRPRSPDADLTSRQPRPRVTSAQRLRQKRRCWEAALRQDMALLLAQQPTAAQAVRCHLFLEVLPTCEEPQDPMAPGDRNRIENLLHDNVMIYREN